jgi:hypothetical protein
MDVSERVNVSIVRLDHEHPLHMNLTAWICIVEGATRY